MADLTERILQGMEALSTPGHDMRAEAEAALRADEKRYVLLEDDVRMNLKAGDVLICKPYWLDPHEKLTVLRRESDGFDPSCNVYRSQVQPR